MMEKNKTTLLGYAHKRGFLVSTLLEEVGEEGWEFITVLLTSKTQNTHPSSLSSSQQSQGGHHRRPYHHQ